jgi:DNA methyltransferase 1-associated protein 1
VWKPIVHPARPEVDRDKPFLSHWVKAGEEDVEYPWAKFNKKLAISKYTDEQYKKYFQGEWSDAIPLALHHGLAHASPSSLHFAVGRNTDGDWTREETDTLFDLCERYDLRFIVIHDRFPNPKRTVEVYWPSSRCCVLSCLVGRGCSTV